jgi:hypothetical protein
MADTQTSSTSKLERAARLGTVLFAKSFQAGGLVIGMAEALKDGPAENAVLMFAGFLIIGLEGIQSLGMRFIDRLFGDTESRR